VVQGDLQPLSKLHNLVHFSWLLRRDDLRQVAEQEWTEAMLQEAQQWASAVEQQVQQSMLPSWTQLTHLFLDVEMDRGFLQAVADHCPHLKRLGCSTLSIKESQPQIKLPSLLSLSLLFILTGGHWRPNPVPVSSYAALRAPLLQVVVTAATDGYQELATVTQLQGCLHEGSMLLRSHRLESAAYVPHMVPHWAYAGTGGSNQPPSFERC
jgi:hypothetical protein